MDHVRIDAKAYAVLRNADAALGDLDVADLDHAAAEQAVAALGLAIGLRIEPR